MIPDIYEYSREVINIFLDELRNESFKIILSFKYMLIAFSTDKKFKFETNEQNIIRNLLKQIDEHEKNITCRAMKYEWMSEIQNILDYDEMMEAQYIREYKKYIAEEKQKKCKEERMKKEIYIEKVYIEDQKIKEINLKKEMLLKTLRCIHCDSIETNDFKYINLNDMNFWCSLCSKWNNINKQFT